MSPQLELIVGETPGYGGPGYWTVSAVYNNRLLESVSCYDEMTAGETRASLRAKWSLGIASLDLDSYPLFSPLCDNCGLDLRSGNGGGNCLSKTWCNRPKCKAALDEAIAESKRQDEAREVAYKKRQADARAERMRLAEEAKTGFHWHDNWFFKRMPDGSVRVSNAG